MHCAVCNSNSTDAVKPMLYYWFISWGKVENCVYRGDVFNFHFTCG